MNKTRNNELMKLADDTLQKSTILKDGSIKDSYNGQIAALGVTIAMSGLLPALAIYYKKGTTDVDRKPILEIIAEMISNDNKMTDPDIKKISCAKSLLQTAIESSKNKKQFATLQKEVEECSIALKQVVRTYNLE